jgi:hypothetical protein
MDSGKLGCRWSASSGDVLRPVGDGRTAHVAVCSAAW